MGFRLNDQTRTALVGQVDGFVRLTIMDVQVIETVCGSGTEWGLSFDGPNPHGDDYFGVTDSNTAFRLRDRILAEGAAPNETTKRVS